MGLVIIQSIEQTRLMSSPSHGGCRALFRLLASRSFLNDNLITQVTEL